MSLADPLPTKPEYAKNRHILEWWTDEHDDLIVSEIEDKQWIWHWSIVDRIVEATSKEVIRAWQERDPLCSKYAWNNVLMYFAAARAKQKGLTKLIRSPQIVTCAACKREFSEDSFVASVVKHLGMNQIDICMNCIGMKFFQGSGNDSASREEVLAYIRDLAEALESIPSQSFGETLSSLTHLSTSERAAAVKVLERKPTIRRVKSLFGSWLNALIEAGVVEDGKRKTTRGTQCIAKDGHVCLSLGEKTIDDFLYQHHIDHEKEPSYPEGNYRADFRVGNTLIEYFGLSGDTEYDKKTAEKISICKRNSIQLIAIYPTDLSGGNSLKSKLRQILKEQPGVP